MWCAHFVTPGGNRPRARVARRTAAALITMLSRTSRPRPPPSPPSGAEPTPPFLGTGPALDEETNLLGLPRPFKGGCQVGCCESSPPPGGLGLRPREYSNWTRFASLETWLAAWEASMGASKGP
eukprot:898202-Prorocentrum_minimum.AAC.4